jgi:hypothetical protein
MRENVDMSFIFRMHSIAQKEAVIENFLGHIPKKVALNIMETAVWKDDKSEQRQCLVVDNSGNSNINEMLYALQPQEVPVCRLRLQP